MKRLAACLILVFVGCWSQPTENDPGELAQRLQAPQAGPRVVAVSYPLQQLAQALVGDQVDVEYPCQGPDPSNWQPDRDSILKMQSADLIITNGTGADYAKWLTTVSLPSAKVCATASRGLSLKDFIAVEDIRLVHSHGPEGEHSHPLMISRTWLDPNLAIKQAAYLSGQLQERYPEQAAAIAQKEQELRQQLEAIAAAVPAQDPAATPPVVLTATPQLKFFTRFMGLEDRHFSWDAQTSAEQLATELDTVLKDAEAESGRPKLLLVPEGHPVWQLANWETTLAQRGLTAVSIDLIDNPQEDRSYLERLKTNVAVLADQLR